MSRLVGVSFHHLRYQGRMDQKWYKIYEVEDLLITRWGGANSNGQYNITKMGNSIKVAKASREKMADKTKGGYKLVHSTGFTIAERMFAELESPYGFQAEIALESLAALGDGVLAEQLSVNAPPVASPQDDRPGVVHAAEELLKFINTREIGLEELLEAWTRLDTSWREMDAAHQQLGPIVAEVRKKVTERLMGGAT